MSKVIQTQSATFSQVMVAAMLASHFLPVSAYGDTDHAEIDVVWGSGYRSGSNGPTYSHLGSPLTGEYIYARQDPEFSTLTPDLEEFLRNSPSVTMEGFEHLLKAIRSTYGAIHISAALHTDPEEGWIKPVITIHSDVDDFEALLDIEDSFFDSAASDPALLSILPFVVLSTS